MVTLGVCMANVNRAANVQHIVDQGVNVIEKLAKLVGPHQVVFILSEGVGFPLCRHTVSGGTTFTRFRIVVDIVRGVGEDHIGALGSSANQAPHIGYFYGVAAKKSVIAQDPKVA